MHRIAVTDADGKDGGIDRLMVNRLSEAFKETGAVIALGTNAVPKRKESCHQ